MASPQVAKGQQDTTTRRDSTRTRLREVRIEAEGPRTTTTVGSVSAVVLAIDSLYLTPAAPVADVLREMPFVLVRQNSRGEAELSVRGSDSRQAVILFDGIPLTIGWDNRADMSVFPLSGAGNIVLVRGLSSLLQGPNSLGGVLDMGVVSGRASRLENTQLALRVGTDQFGSQGYQVDWAQPLVVGNGEFTWRAGGGYRSQEAVALGADVADIYSTRSGRRANSDVTQRDLYVATRYQTSTGAWLGVGYSRNRSERGVMPELHITAPRFWRYPDQGRSLTVVSAGTGRQRTPFGSGDLEVVVGRNASHSLVESFADEKYETVMGREHGRERTTTARLLADHSMGRGELRTAFTLATVRYTETIDQATPNEYEQRLWSSAVEMEQPLTGMWRLSGGIALDGSTTPQTGGKPSLGRLSEWGGRLGLSTLAFGTWKFHAAVSRRARFASLRELYSGALNRFVPNPSLRPERLVGAEVGGTLLSTSYQFQGVLFAHRLEDAVVRITLPNRSFQRINRDELRSIGIEALGGWKSGATSITADVLLQHVRLEDPATAGSERRPEHQPEFRAGIDAAFPVGAGVRGKVGFNHTGVQYCVHPDLQRNHRLGSQTWGSAGVDRTFTLRSGGLLSRVLASFAIDNVTDAAVYDQCGLPYQGRTIRFGLTLH